LKASEFRNKIAAVFKMIYWNSGTRASEFRKTLFRNTYFGVQVNEVMDHIFIRNQALQPQAKKTILVQENK
jgi:hypothetical protein